MNLSTHFLLSTSAESYDDELPRLWTETMYRLLKNFESQISKSLANVCSVAVNLFDAGRISFTARLSASMPSMPAKEGILVALILIHLGSALWCFSHLIIKSAASQSCASADIASEENLPSDVARSRMPNQTENAPCTSDVRAATEQLQRTIQPSGPSVAADASNQPDSNPATTASLSGAVDNATEVDGSADADSAPEAEANAIADIDNATDAFPQTEAGNASAAAICQMRRHPQQILLRYVRPRDSHWPYLYRRAFQATNHRGDGIIRLSGIQVRRDLDAGILAPGPQVHRHEWDWVGVEWVD